MTEIRFSMIGELSPTMETIIQGFEKQFNHRVVTEVLSWGNAWPQLLSWVLDENSPHVSQIGSTWAISLFKLNALRAYTLSEIRSMGSQLAYLPQTWQTTQSGTGETLGIPWNSYTFILAYRKDALQKAEIDPKNAFASFNALAETLLKLRNNGVKTPWVVPASKNYLSTLHFLASWVWDAVEILSLETGKMQCLINRKLLRRSSGILISCDI